MGSAPSATAGRRGQSNGSQGYTYFHSVESHQYPYPLFAGAVVLGGLVGADPILTVWTNHLPSSP